VQVHTVELVSRCLTLLPFSFKQSLPLFTHPVYVLLWPCVLCLQHPASLNACSLVSTPSPPSLLSYSMATSDPTNQAGGPLLLLLLLPPLLLLLSPLCGLAMRLTDSSTANFVFTE